MNKAVFFDRDGVLIHDSHLITSMNQVEVITGAAELISSVRELGFKTFLYTNQTVVSRGMISHREAIELNLEILKSISDKNNGALIDEVFLCPHHPDSSIKEFAVDCQCRKPKPGMILAAAQKHNIDLSKSFAIGDRLSDIVAANLSGCTSIHFLSQKSKDKLIKSNLRYDPQKLRPSFISASMEDIYKFIEENCS